MAKRRLSLLLFAVLVGRGKSAVPPTIITPPAPAHDGPMSLEKALSKRRSIRAFRDEALTLAEVGQLLWATQGISDSDGRRTAPSAGALFPLEVYAVVGRVGGHAPGVYRHQPRDHTLALVSAGDRRAPGGGGARAALVRRSSARGGDRGRRRTYHAETRHARAALGRAGGGSHWGESLPAGRRARTRCDRRGRVRRRRGSGASSAAPARTAARAHSRGPAALRRGADPTSPVRSL